MFLVDTSVWIHALRPTGTRAIQEHLKPLISSDQTAITEYGYLVNSTAYHIWRSRGFALESCHDMLGLVESSKYPFHGMGAPRVDDRTPEIGTERESPHVVCPGQAIIVPTLMVGARVGVCRPASETGRFNQCG